MKKDKRQYGIWFKRTPDAAVEAWCLNCPSKEATKSFTLEILEGEGVDIDGVKIIEVSREDDTE